MTRPSLEGEKEKTTTSKTVEGNRTNRDANHSVRMVEKLGAYCKQREGVRWVLLARRKEVRNTLL